MLDDYTVLCPFGGSGGGALGFLGAEVRLLGEVGRFRCLGSIDFDAVACADFERLVGSPALCANVETLTVDELRAFVGARRPDVVFMSPPCKGSSRLLSAAKARTAKYRRMNRLSVVWTELMLEAWRDDPPPLVLLENVPGLPTRARAMLRSIRALLRVAGYVFHASTHDCGELGGLAQHRERYLLVARRPETCASFLYQPPKKRVRGIGEVLCDLPMPATAAAKAWGDLHTMPRLSWRNWLRLALIPAGGDWRDLAGVLLGRARRTVFRRHPVADWQEPLDAVTGPGGMGPEAVAEPRWNRGAYGVRAWDDASGVVTGGADHPSRGEFSVADPRVELGCEPHAGAYGVVDFEAPSPTVTGGRVDNRPVSVADPRVEMNESSARHWNKLDVRGWSDPALTVIGKEGPANGGASVADPRFPDRKPNTFRNVDRVHPFDEPAPAITGAVKPSNGLASIADPRLEVPVAYDAGYGVLGWDQPARVIAGTTAAGTGANAVADPRDRGFVEGVRLFTLDEAMALDLDAGKAPPFVPVIVAEDGTWHRPLTLLELAALQGFPTRVDGEPVVFAGTRTGRAERVGNAVPPPAAQAVAERMLVALMEASLGAMSLSSLAFWVEPHRGEEVSWNW